MESAESERSFSPTEVDLDLLRRKAFNYLWASVPDGVIPLTAASSDFKVAKPIRDAVVEYVDEGYLCYAPGAGLPEFREEFAQYYADKLARAIDGPEGGRLEGRREVAASEVMASNACAAAVYDAVATILTKEGDEALVMAPVDFLLSRSVEALPGRRVVRYGVTKRTIPDANPDGDDGGRGAIADIAFSVEEMESLVTPKTKLLSVCHPHNPLGKVWTAPELRLLADFAERHGLKILSDEVWGDVVYAPRVFVPMMAVSEYAGKNTYTVTGFSKNFGIEGARIGGLIAPTAEDLERVLEVSGAGATAGGASTLAQVAALAAMRRLCAPAGRSWLDGWVDFLHGQAKYAAGRLRGMPGVQAAREPEGCFILWADVSGVFEDVQAFEAKAKALGAAQKNGEEPSPPMVRFVDWLRDRHKVAVIPGLEAFFGPGSHGHIRISVATSREILAEGLDRLEGGLAEWRDGGAG